MMREGYGHYDYRMRLQVQDNTLQADTLKHLKDLATSPDFNERERLLVSTCAYWMVEALVQAEAPTEEIQAAAIDSIAEMAYQIQQIADLADVDLAAIKLPPPVRSLAVGSHAGLREQFVSVLARGTGRPGAKPKRTRTKTKPASSVGAHDAPELEPAQPQELLSAKRSQAAAAPPATKTAATSARSRTKAKTANYNVDLF